MKQPENKNIAPSQIGLYWDQLWRQLHASEEPALWDVPPSLAVGQDYSIFQSTFNSDLPVLDIGCGSGIQSQFLGTHYSDVYGIDASKKAIAAAQKLNEQTEVIFERVNLLDEKAVDVFYEKIGAANIYLRGVIHQIPLEHRPVFVRNIKHLMGASGTIYLIETAPNIQNYIEALAEKFSELPVSLKRVLTSHFPPLGVSLEEIQGWFGSESYEILKTGKAVLQTNLSSDDDQKIGLPAVYALVKKQEK